MLITRREMIATALSSALYPAISPAFAQSLLFDAGQYANVRDHGALGNGVHDDTLAVYKASRTGKPVFFPKGSYRITRKIDLGQRIVWEGEGRASTIVSDSAVLEVQNGTGSRIRNLNFINRTAPLCVQRNPENWTQNRQVVSNTGYQPTVNDQDIWDRLNQRIQQQDIGPALRFLGNADDIAIERLYGRFLSILLCDASNSQVTDCDFKGGKNFAGGIVLWNIDGQIGQGNVVQRNTVREASFSGIALARNVGATVTGNTCIANGESGIKTWQGDVAGKDASCRSCDISSNTTSDNYYDGLDIGSDIPHSGKKATRHTILENISRRNRGCGFYGDGRFNQFANNTAESCGNGGIKFRFSDSIIRNNRVANCNTLGLATDGNQIGIVGDNNVIEDNAVVQSRARSHSFYIVGKNKLSKNLANDIDIKETLIY